jgi:hypothetical protein
MSKILELEKPKTDKVEERISVALAEERQRQRLFLNGFFWGVLFVLWLTQLVRGISQRED